ncbi:MAG: hypothetical protein AAGK23_04335 [Pseudomonadota bacterium]
MSETTFTIKKLRDMLYNSDHEYKGRSKLQETTDYEMLKNMLYEDFMERAISLIEEHYRIMGRDGNKRSPDDGDIPFNRLAVPITMIVEGRGDDEVPLVFRAACCGEGCKQW